MSETITSETTTVNVPLPPPEFHKTHTREHPLSSEQRLAIHLLLNGHTDQQAADAVRLDRSTITRWRLYHPSFRAELNRQREALWLNHADRIRAIAARALDVLQNHLSSTSERSSFRAAICILRLATKITPPIGPTDEWDLITQHLIDDHREEEKHGGDIHWPPRKKDLDAFRDYLLRRAANLPPRLPKDESSQPQPLTQASLPQ